MSKAETIFAHELSLIHDNDIKQFVITCFDKLCPDYFWTCPCSTTGKYHPQVSLGVGGLVRHTKLAVWWGIELLRALSEEPGLKKIPPKQLFDEVIATLLLHDLIKNGKGLNAKGYPLDRGVTGTHGVTLAYRIDEEKLGHELSDEVFSRIFYGIACHMGIWTTGNIFKPNNLISPTYPQAFAQLIHLADYCASRKVDDIYRKLQGERDGINQQTTETTKNFGPDTKTTTESPPCPGVHKTESRQTDSENGQ